MSKSFHVVLNGSRKGLIKPSWPKLSKLLPLSSNQAIIMTDTTDETLYSLKQEYPDTRSYYIYDRSDLADKTLHDVDCPNLSLYDDFIDVSPKH